MVPLVDFAEELSELRELVERTAGQVAEELATPPVPFTVGTMIELPRACLIADQLAREATFFSFGTNDLTQTALGFSRDDAEGRFLTEYLRRRIVSRSPFETIDREGVGELLSAAIERGRRGRPELSWASAASTGAIRTASPSSTRWGSTTSAVRRSGSRSPVWRLLRPRSLPTSHGAGETPATRQRPCDPRVEHVQVGDCRIDRREPETDLSPS